VGAAGSSIRPARPPSSVDPPGLSDFSTSANNTQQDTFIFQAFIFQTSEQTEHLGTISPTGSSGD
jgi:hypothetical protein